MKKALIIGGTKGIGRAVSLELLEKGFHLFVVYSSDEEAVLSIKKQITSIKRDHINFIKLDFGIFDNIAILFSNISKLLKGKKLDAIIINTGKTNRSAFEVLSLTEWQEVINFNCTIPLFMIQKFVPLLNENSSIIFTGSLMGIYPHSVSIPYGVSKSAVHAITRNLVKVLSPYKIRINTVVPGFVNTDWHKSKSDFVINNINKKISLHRFAETTEVAKVYSFILENEYINGQEIVIDGSYMYE